MALHCLDILGCTPWWICWVLFEILFGQVGDLGEGRSSHGCASYISPEVFLTQYWYSIHRCLHQCRVDDLKSGRESARVSSRGLVRAQHTNSRGENAFNAMTLSNQKPPFVFYHHMWVSGFQPGDREMEGGGRPQLPQEGALPSGGKVFHIFVMTMTFQTAEGGRVVALGGRW